MNDLKPFLETILELADPWFIDEITFDQEQVRIDIYLDFRKGGTFSCPLCGTSGCKVHDSTMKSWRHMNLFQYKAYLHARLPRVACPSHGIHTAKVPWAREGSGFTLLFEAFAMSLIRFMPVASAARILDEWDTRIWRIAHHYVDKAVEKQDLSHVTAVGVDETARKRGHNYISAFVDLERKGTVFVTEGKGKDVLQAFKSFLEGHGGSPDQVSDFTIDMSPAFITGIEEHFPEARITFDKLLVCKLMNEALDEVRRMEQIENRGLKKTRFIWLRNPENLTKAQKETLDSLTGSRANRKVARAWRIKLALQQVYCRNSRWASYFLDRWYGWASHSRLAPITKFAKTVKRHKEGILNYVKTRSTNGILEGLNSLFKAAAAKARGFRTVRNAITAYYLVAGRFELGLPEIGNATHTK
ncbi:ISL3 family transposase [Aminirod propionatiphilus]|uniref:ISL3 family transposase n=1 Tax=Aminirod propionatiphilus TaxID=3415223 RepID=UPI003BFA73BF